MKITVSGNLARRKAAAEGKINARFNRLAADSLHADLIALAFSQAPSALKREPERAALIERVNAAQSPDDIETILQELERR